MGVHSVGDDESPAESILHEVAKQTGGSPATLNPPLFDVIDPDALDTIFRGDTGHITFEYQGFEVTVDHSGNVNVEPTKTD